MKWAYGRPTMAPAPSGAIPLNCGVVTLRAEGEMLSNRFHVTLSYISKITISLLPRISTEPSSLRILTHGSDKGYAETTPTQLLEKDLRPTTSSLDRIPNIRWGDLASLNYPFFSSFF